MHTTQYSGTLMLTVHVTTQGGMSMPIGTGIEASTAEKYRQEWQLYIRFCERRGWKQVPGRDCKWSIEAVRPYIMWRASNNNVRSVRQIKSKLKHCGLCYNHLLPTAKGETPARLRLQLAMLTKEISKRERLRKKKAGIPQGPKRSLALGRVAISMLFSAYNATTRKSFNKLPEDVRHRLVICACMHTACMRFQLIRELYKKGEMRWSQPSEMFMMAADWNKMRREVGEYTVKFPMKPRLKAMIYAAYGRKGEVLHSFTAAKVLKWHLANVKSRRGKDLFAPSFGEMPSSEEFKAWLRESFRMLLVGDKREIDALVKSITPHSFRAGMAGDLERDDVPRLTIKKLGRWASNEAMEQYMRDGLAQRLQKLRYWHIASIGGRVKRMSARPRVAKIEEEDTSEGYDDSDEEEI